MSLNPIIAAFQKNVLLEIVFSDMTLHFHFMILFYYYFKCQVHIINAVSVICTILITSQYVLSFARRTRLISLYSFPPKMLRPVPKVFAPTQVSRLNFTNNNFSIQPPENMPMILYYPSRAAVSLVCEAKPRSLFRMFGLHFDKSRVA